MGATRATNNTAEMQALIEALFSLNMCVEKRLPFSSKVMITVDSLYVKGSSMRSSWRVRTER